MAPKVDSLSLAFNTKVTRLISKTDINRHIELFENNNAKSNVDEFSIYSRISETNLEKKADNRKKWLIGAGIAFGIITAGVVAYLLKHSLNNFKPLTNKLKTCNIEPKSFADTTGEYLSPKFLDKYIKDIQPYAEHATIKAEYKPRTLEQVFGIRRTLDASNFVYPRGTIAIPAKLNEVVSTSGLLQCSAIAIVDKSQNLQTLVHCCPTVKGNESLLKYIFSHSTSKNLDITIVPGFYKETDTTVDFLVNMVKKYAPDAKLNFANFPNKDIDVVILKNGILKSGTRNNIIPTTNPINRIIHA